MTLINKSLVYVLIELRQFVYKPKPIKRPDAALAEWGIPLEFNNILTDSCADTFQIATPRFNLLKPFNDITDLF